MRPIKIEFTGTTTGSKVARMNYRQASFKVGFGVSLASTGTYTVQHTFQDPADFANVAAWIASADWFDNDDAGLVAATASADGNYNFPIQGIKLVVAANGSGIEMNILQGSAA